ncbi:MAG: oligosaccharide flippase family protein [Candidatus Pacearchaeota archaeon]
MPKLSKAKPQASNTTQRVVKSSFYNSLAMAINKFGALIFTILVARMLFPELFGLYSIALTFILIAVSFIDYGINATMVRYLAEVLKKKSVKAEIEARSKFFFLLNFKVILTGILALVIFALADILAVYLFNKPLLTLPLRLSAIYLFLLSIHAFWTSIFYLMQRVNYSVMAETIFQVLRIVLVAIIFLFYKTVDAVFIALIIAVLISFMYLYLISIKKYGFLFRGKRIKLEKNEKKKLISFSAWLTISSFTLIFFTHVDLFMLGIFLPAEFPGFYNAIISLVIAVAVLVGFGFVLLPVFAQLEQGRLERGFSKVFRYVNLVAIPASIGLAYISTSVIKAIYGAAYVPTEYRLAIIFTSALLSLLVAEIALTSIFSSLFQSREKHKIPAILIIIAIITNIILNYIFIRLGLTIAPQYCLVGVALATLLTRYGNLIALASIAKKKFNIKLQINALIKTLIASALMLGFLMLTDYLIVLNILAGILLVITAIIVYIAIMFVIKGIKREDFELIKLLH